MRQSIEVHTTATISDLPSLASSARSASEKSATNDGVPASPPSNPPGPTLGKRKRDEQSPPGGSTSSDRMRHRGLADNDALASIICSVSSLAGDPRPSQNDVVPEILDQTAARLSPPAITAATTQHVQCARPELGAVPDASTTRVFHHAEMHHGGAMEPEAVAATPGKTLPDILPEGRIIAPSADEQSEIPSISTDNRQSGQLVEGSDSITPKPFFVHEDQNVHRVQDEDASPRPHHTINHFDYPSPSISQPDTSSAELLGIDIAATDERAPTPYASLSQSTDLIMRGLDVARAVHSPPIVSATSGLPLPPQSSERGIPASLPMPINSDSHYVTAGYLLDGDRHPNTRQRTLAGDAGFSRDSVQTGGTPHFAHYGTPAHHSTGSTYFPVMTHLEHNQSCRSQAEAAQVWLFDDNMSHVCHGFPIKYSLSYIMAPDLRSNRNDWQQVALIQESASAQHATATRSPRLYKPMLLLNGERPSFAADTTAPAAIQAVLGSDLLDRTWKSQQRKTEIMLQTNTVITYQYEKHWVITLTLGPSNGPIDEAQSMNMLKNRVADGIRASPEEQERIAIQKSYPLSDEGDYQLACIMDWTRGLEMVRALHDLSSLILLT
jgi:hypothetical protein